MVQRLQRILIWENWNCKKTDDWCKSSSTQFSGGQAFLSTFVFLTVNLTAAINSHIINSTLNIQEIKTNIMCEMAPESKIYDKQCFLLNYISYSALFRSFVFLYNSEQVPGETLSTVMKNSWLFFVLRLVFPSVAQQIRRATSRWLFPKSEGRSSLSIKLRRCSKHQQHHY